MGENGDISKKNKLAAVLLCNPLGCHRFYLGKTTSGILMLVFSILIFALPITIIIAVVDFFSTISGKMTDSEGKTVTYWVTNE
jgi:TM2 domain-containing membrane protein YozV